MRDTCLAMPEVEYGEYKGGEGTSWSGRSVGISVALLADFSFSAVVCLVTTGRFPNAFALGSAGSCEPTVAVCSPPSAIGEGARKGVPEPLELPDDGPSFDPESDVTEDCELFFLGNTGLLFAAAVEATIFLACDFFLDGEATFGTCCRISNAGVMVLVEEGALLLSPSSSDGCGDTKRAVGRGPDVEGPLGFFKIGCDAGGLAALEERSRRRLFSLSAVSLW